MLECLKRLPRFWFPDRMAFWGLLLVLPPLLFFQTTVHEGTHGLEHFFVTGDFPKVAPFPNIFDGRFQNGITIGNLATVTRASCDDPALRVHGKLPGFIALPQFVDLLLAGLLTLIFLYVPVSNPLVRFVLRVWFIGLCIDFTFNTARGLIGICVDAMDWSKFMLEYGMGRGVFGVLTWFLWLVLIGLIVLACKSRWLDESVAETSFWDYQWVAFACGVLSLLAVLVSIFVSEPGRIDKGTAAFIVPFVVQILAVCWYGFYFAVLVRGSQE
jgi:hypothetical protein